MSDKNEESLIKELHSFELRANPDHPEIQEIFEQLKVMDAFQKVGTISVKELNEQLRMSKLFLNMVIHDMRNPTTSIKMGLEDTIFKIKDINQIYKE
jgi:signal transduction histidine kinase